MFQNFKSNRENISYKELARQARPTTLRNSNTSRAGSI